MVLLGGESRSDREVEVLLSTYNPNHYLVELLESVRQQTYPYVGLSVRDDGSQAGARRCVESLLERYPNARFSWGENLGPRDSFLTLLSGVHGAASYAAFCDQDDVWNAEKLEVAVEAIEGLEGPAMYCSAIQLVTSELKPIALHRRCVRGPAFANALVENIATGCTIVLNRAAIDLIVSRLPRRAIMHDAWSYLVISACGTVIYDPEPRVRYRLHDKNAIGVATDLLSEIARRTRRQCRSGRDRQLTAQAEELRALFGAELSVSVLKELATFLDSASRPIDRLVYSVRGGAFRQRRIDDLIFRLLYLLRRI